MKRAGRWSILVERETGRTTGGKEIRVNRIVVTAGSFYFWRGFDAIFGIGICGGHVF